MRLYDVLLVNPVRDGMNLVAQEGPVVNRAEGVVVLSSAAGSNDILQDGVVTIRDPRDVAETADALECALDMPIAERRRRARLLAARMPFATPSLG